MPQLFALAALAVGGYVLARAVRREMNRVEARVSKSANDKAKRERVATLERDPETGRYRPREG
ncbi:hypothetical protein HPQ64_18820 [Rhizobiales bacterium]|uniref:hypothetical protein n=1 Tax=Hongsoonwoonella zoysiae TaxID=2821844 RepID=UPI00155FAD27|nr:hypothetical protein [Hongsoonwoonella zoysiae]NRG19749.1 hypothetical protein [Hongsoonwoonella zoysiae]